MDAFGNGGVPWWVDLTTRELLALVGAVGVAVGFVVALVLVGWSRGAK